MKKGTTEFRKRDAKYQKEKRERRKAQGLCIYCPNPVSDNGYMCTQCIERRKVARDSRRNRGKCFDCEQPSLPGKTRCEKHQKMANKALNRLFKKRRATGKCPDCGKPTEGKGTRCRPCLDKAKHKRLELRREIFNAYGGCSCQCCGCDFLELLTLEHPDGDGAAHRKQLGGGGETMYRKLKKMGFPQTPRLTVLCFSCNAALGLYGYCPHQRELEKLIGKLSSIPLTY